MNRTHILVWRNGQNAQRGERFFILQFIRDQLPMNFPTRKSSALGGWRNRIRIHHGCYPPPQEELLIL